MLYCSIRSEGEVPSKDSNNRQRKRRADLTFFCFCLLALLNGMWPHKLLSISWNLSKLSSRQNGSALVKIWRRDLISWVSRSPFSFSRRPLLPLANAFAPQSTTITTRREARSFPPLSAIIVPELDDTFPEDFDSNSNNNSTQGDLPPPLVSGDYFSGADDFQLEDIPTSLPEDGFNSIPKENIINPFPFPGPEDDGSDATTTSSMESQLERSPFSAVPKTPTKDGQNNNDLGDAMQKLKNMNDSITQLTNDNGTDKSIQFSSTSPISEINSNRPTGRRTMATMASEKEKDTEENEPTEEYDLWQPIDLEQSTTATEQPPEDAAFVQFSSIMDDSGPIKPLVAPLKLSKPSKTAAQSEPSDTTSLSVPSIEANGLDDLVDSLQGQLKNIQREIEVMAGEKAKSINLNSPKQISELLFGRPDMSTNKSTLEGMAASNILAKLILEYRETKRKLNKTLKQQEDRTASNGEDASESSSIAPPKPMIDPVMLIDTSSFIFRAYYSNPPIHRARDGMPTGAVMGFCSMLNKLLLNSMLRGETPILIHCLDAPGKSFRNDLYPDYKAHRPPIPLDLVPQFNLINKAIKAYGMIQIQAPGFEADDVIATLATRGSQTEGLDVKILSGDKDLMQLVTEDDDDYWENDKGMVHQVDPMTSKVWNHDMVIDKWGVKPSQLGDVLALAGDAADNVPGVPGIGPKIAAQLLQEFGTLESLLDNTDEIPQPKRREKLKTNADLARISRELVDLQRGLDWSQMEAFLPPPTDGGNAAKTATPMLESTKISELRMQPIQVDRILAFYDDMGFHKLKTQLLDRVGKVQPSGPTGSEPSAAAVVPSKAPVAASKPADAKATTTKPKARPKRTYWEKTKRTVPKPEDFKDVPF